MVRTHWMMALAALLVLVPGCPGGDDDDSAAPDAPVEPLDLPGDPAAMGVPVGVTTVQHAGLTVEVWYPATDAVAGQAGDVVQMSEFVPYSVTEVLGEVELPPIETAAIRDAAPRRADAPYPFVVFSHGFAGFRTHSASFTVHLASRGYVVVAADHTGRTIGDVLPCLFNPPLEGCDMEGLLSGTDPAPDQVDEVLGWIEASVIAAGMFAGLADAERIALVGFSAGGVTTSTVAQYEERIDTMVLMGGAGENSRDLPSLFLGGSCDAMFTMERLDDAHTMAADGQLVEILGAGHLAFTDLCTLELATFASDVLESRDDINALFLDSMLDLATDGCPGFAPVEPLPDEDCSGTYLPLETSTPIIDHYATVFLDQQLYGAGPGVEAGLFGEAIVR
jgi:dienelactone hydrolase